MGMLNLASGSWILITFIVLLALPSPAAAFGAGNIPSIAQVEGLNFRHGGKMLSVEISQPSEKVN